MSQSVNIQNIGNKLKLYNAKLSVSKIKIFQFSPLSFKTTEQRFF